MRLFRLSLDGKVRHHHVLVLVLAVALLGGIQWWRTAHTGTVDAVFNSTPETPAFGVQGELFDVIKDGTTLYLAGQFQAIGKPSSGLALISKSTGESTDDSFPDIPNNTIQVAVSDEAGGYYIGGTFTMFGEETRNYLAHILADGSVDAGFDPDLDGDVEALAYDGDNGILYAGGSFQNVNGGAEPRVALAAFDAATGEATSFDADMTPGQSVRALVLDGTTLYAGGNFTSVNGGTTRNRLAAFDTSTGVATSFDPNINSGASDVRTLLLDGTTLYAGGTFTSVNGGTTRNRLAAFDTGTGLVTGFDPNIGNYSVAALAIDTGNGVLYAGGQFNSVNGGTARTLLAAFDAATGVVEPFEVSEIYNNGPGNSGQVTTLLLDGTTLYIGGQWTTTGLLPANPFENLYAVEATTGDQIEFSKPGGEVGAIVDAGSDVFITGSFRTIDSTMVNNLATVDMDTGAVTDFDTPGGEVKSIALDSAGGILYVGGDFTTVINCGNRNYLAAFDVTTGSCTTFDPDLDGTVYELLLDGTTLYAGGFFTAVNFGSETRNGVVAFDTGTGVATSFDPNLYNQAEGNPGGAMSFVLNGSTLYVGGYFDEVNGATTRNSLAAFDTSTGITNAFDPDIFDDNEGAVGQVTELILDGDTLYVGGSFTTVNGGTARNHLAAFDVTDGTATGFDPYPDDSVSALLLDGTTLYAGGGFASVNDGDYDRNRLAAFNIATGTATSFNPNINGAVNVLLPGSLIAAGAFSSVGGDIFSGIAIFPELVIPDPVAGDFDSTPNSLNWGTDGDVYALAYADDGTLYFGGGFSLVGRVSGAGAILDAVTGVLADASPQINGQVNAVISDGAGGWYVGGAFSVVDGVTRNNVAHILSDGSLDEDFDPNVNDQVHALALEGTTLYVGGEFDTVNGGTTRNRLAAFDTSNGLATAFDPDVMTTLVYTLVIDGTTIYAGGIFDTVNGGTTRNYLAAFDTSTGVATSFNPNLNNAVRALVLDGTTLYAGGYFTMVNGATPRGKLAAFDTATGLATSFDADIDTAFSDVYAILLDGTTLYVGGDIGNVNGAVPRSNLAAFDTGTGTVTSFDPNMGHRVLALALNGTTLYAGGVFSDVNGGTLRSGLAALDTTTGIATDFAPQPNSNVRALAFDGTSLFAGGPFTLMNTETRNNLAAIDLTADALTSFDPDLDAGVYSLALDGATLYAGGGFNTVNGGTTRNLLAAFDTASGLVTAFDPNLSGGSLVDEIILDGTTLYVGGQFTAVNGGTPRNYLAAFDTGTGVATSFDPDISNDVYALALDGTTLYAGGNFDTVNGGTARNSLAAFDTGTGVVTSLDPDLGATGEAYTFLLDGSTLYVGGRFTEVNGGTSRSNLAAFSTVTGTATSFDPDVACQCGGGGNIVTLALDTSTLYAGGEFDEVNGGTSRVNMAAFSISDGVATDFDVDPDGQVYALLLHNPTLYMGGEFTVLNQGTAPMLRSHLAAFDGDASTPTPTSDEGSAQTGSFINPSLLPLFSPTVTPIYTPDPAGAVILNDGSTATPSRFVKVTYDNPFDDAVGVSIRTVNADALVPSDRELIYQQRYGKELPVSAPTQQLRNDGTLQLLDTTGNIELTSGAVRSFTPTVLNWDLCGGAPSCPAGTYTVFAQFTKPTSGALSTLGAIGDQVSDIYSDSIVYAPATLTPAATSTATPAPAVSGAPTPTVTPSVSGSPAPTSSAVAPAPSGAPVPPVSPSAPILGVPTSAVSAAAFTAAVLSVIPILLSSLSLARNGLDGYYALAFALQSLMTATGLKRKPHLWGVVYDVGTKHGIPYAKMELINEQGRVLETRFADRDGRYGFLSGSESVQQEKLVVRIRPSAAGYLFPSVRISLTATDYIVYDHLYGGEPLTIEPGAFITRNIPMDAQLWRPRRFSEMFPLLSIGTSTSWLLNLAFWVGLIAVPWAYWKNPTTLNLVMLILFFSVNGFRWLSGLYRPFGTVRDAATGKPVSYALVTLTDSAGIRATFSVTDEKGRYYLVAQQPGSYTVSAFTPANISPQRTAATQVSVTKGWTAPHLKL